MLAQQRLFCLHSTRDRLLYYNEVSNTICHGPNDSAPRNLILFLYEDQGLLYVLSSSLANFRHIDDVYDYLSIHLKLGNGPTNLVVETAADGMVSINFKGKFLSCGANADVRFSKEVCSEDEKFRPVPIEPIAGQPVTRPVRPNHPRAGQEFSFTLLGPFGSNWSLASVNRRLALQLENTFPGSCRIVADENPVANVPSEQVARIADLRARAPATAGTHVAIHQRWPVVTADIHGDITLAYFFWEEGRVPSEAVAALNTFDAVLVSADFVGKALIDSGLTRPMATIGYSPDLKPFETLFHPASPRKRKPLTFLHVSSSEQRKGLDVLIHAYARCFRAGDAVRLIIKGQSVLAQPYIDQVRNSYSNMAEIILIDQQLDTDSLVQLYGSADVMVLPTRGEGFNVPAAEAIAAGLQLIVTGHGGHMQFCRAGVARLLKYQLTQALSIFSQPNSLWAEPDLEDLCSAMLEARAGLIQIDHAVRAEVLAKLDGRAWTEHLVDQVRLLLEAS